MWRCVESRASFFCMLKPWRLVSCSWPAGVLLIYLEGHWDLVSRLITGIARVAIWFIGAINLLTTSPGPSN